MANRNFSRHQSLQKEVKSLHLEINTDASGDVVSIKGEGIQSVSHASDVYTIVLQDQYTRLLSMSVMSNVAAIFTLNSSNMTSKQIEIEASVTQVSAKMLINMDLKNSTVGE